MRALSKFSQNFLQISYAGNINIIRNLKHFFNDYRKRENPSASRNSEPILNILKQVLNQNQNNLKLLEISSGTGQHSAYFANEFKNINFYPSEYDKSEFDSINAYAADVQHKNMESPNYIDVRTNCKDWETKYESETFDYMLNINMIHISPWQCTEGLFQNAGQLLKKNGLLITYGPYAVDGILKPQSNVGFNEMLKGQNPEWGVRDIRDLKEVAKKYNIYLKNTYEMPANNKTLIWEKK